MQCLPLAASPLNDPATRPLDHAIFTWLHNVALLLLHSVLVHTQTQLLLLITMMMMMMRVSVTSLLLILSIYYSAAWTHVQRQGFYSILSLSSYNPTVWAPRLSELHLLPCSAPKEPQPRCPAGRS